MKKKFIMLALALLLCIALALPCLADSARLADTAGLLSNEDAEYIAQRLDEASEKWDADIVVLTTDSLDGLDCIDYADNFYLSQGYRDDGVIFLISMDERECWMSLYGDCYGLITDSGITYTSENVLPYLSDGDYREAFDAYIDSCDYLLDYYAQSGEAYGEYEGWEDIFDGEDDIYYPGYVENRGLDPMWIPGALLVGIVIALISCSVMKSSMKTVRSNDSAASYVKGGSLNLTERRDVFLYANVARVPKPKDDNNNHGGMGGGGGVSFGSSGHSHGGGGHF